jgi:selenocysteine-specific elongation factor
LSSLIRRDTANTLPGYLPIDRVFSKTGYGVVVTGTLVRGSFSVGDSVYIEPGNILARVRGLESFGHPRQKVNAGQRVAMNLSLKANKPLSRGLAVFAQAPSVCRTLIAHLELFEADSSCQSTNDLVGQQIRLYHGTAEKPGHIRWLETVATEYGDKIIAQLSLAEPITAEPSERFVLRYGETGLIGGSLLLGTRPRWLTRMKLLPLTKLLLEHKYEKAINEWVAASPQSMVTSETLNTILPLSERNLIQTELDKGNLVSLGDYVMSAPAKEKLFLRLIKTIKQDKSQTSSEQAGISLETLRSRATPGLNKVSFQKVVKEIVDSGRLIRDGDKLKLPDSEKAGSAKQNESTANDIVDILGSNLCLEIDELAKLVGKSRSTVLSALNQLSKTGKASIVNYDFASSNQNLHKAHLILAQLWQEKREITPSDFKERLATTRKYAMPLLSYFDDHSITRRVANGRILLKKPAESAEN